MKKVGLLLTLAFCLVAFGCSKDAEIDEFIAENDAVMKDMTAKIEADPSAAGIDDAQKSFDAKKDSLKQKWDAIKDARGMQVSEEKQKKLSDSMNNNAKALTDASMKNVGKWAMDKEAMPKFQKLMSDYSNTFK